MTPNEALAHFAGKLPMNPDLDSPVDKTDREALRAIEGVRARLAAAEDVCVLYGWTGGPTKSDREKALFELWAAWLGLVGDGYCHPRHHPHLDDDTITRLAAQRDAIRSATLDRIAELAYRESSE